MLKKIDSPVSWREAWREGIAPQLSTEGLRKLRQALVDDDPALIQGATTSPPPLSCVLDWPVEAACGVTYCGWKGEDLKTVGQAGEFFAQVCFKANRAMQEPAACRWFLNWFDETPRQEMRMKLLAEVKLELGRRALRRLFLASENADPVEHVPQ